MRRQKELEAACGGKKEVRDEGRSYATRTREEMKVRVPRY